MKVFLTAFVNPYFCGLVADDTGLVFRARKKGKFHTIGKIRYSNIDNVEFIGQNFVINTKKGAAFKAIVMEKKYLMNILDQMGVSVIDKKKRAF